MNLPSNYNSKEMDEDMIVLNFHKKPENIKLPSRFDARYDLKMLLSSGDWVVNGKTNIEANPEYDIHVSLPEPASTTKNANMDPLDANMNSIISNPEFKFTKLICYVDYTNKTEMFYFCKVFKHRIAQLGTLDNRILPDVQDILTLLADGGRLIWNLATKIEKTILEANFIKSSTRHTKKSSHNDYIKIGKHVSYSPSLASDAVIKLPSNSRSPSTRNKNKQHKPTNSVSPANQVLAASPVIGNKNKQHKPTNSVSPANQVLAASPANGNKNKGLSPANQVLAASPANGNKNKGLSPANQVSPVNNKTTIKKNKNNKL